jgi:hypothetical protein
MSKSQPFRRLLEECVLPQLQKRLLLASPEDARHRDKYSLLFSLETLFSVESIEKSMLALFEADKRMMLRNSFTAGSPPPNLDTNTAERNLMSEDPIVTLMVKIKIIPNIISVHEVTQLVYDIMPGGGFSGGSGNTVLNSSNAAKRFLTRRSEMTFPQWQWVICVIAFKAVVASIRGTSESLETSNLSLEDDDIKVQYIF